MAQYRIYTLRRPNKITNPPQVVDCADDEIAIKEAKQAMQNETLQIWEGPRLVARLEPDDSANRVR